MSSELSRLDLKKTQLSNHWLSSMPYVCCAVDLDVSGTSSWKDRNWYLFLKWVIEKKKRGFLKFRNTVVQKHIYRYPDNSYFRTLSSAPYHFQERNIQCRAKNSGRWLNAWKRKKNTCTIYIRVSSSQHALWLTIWALQPSRLATSLPSPQTLLLIY